MPSNVFADAVEPPFAIEERWFPLMAENANCAPGDDIPSLSVRRRVRVATTCFTVRRGRPRATGIIESAIIADAFEAVGRVMLARRAKDWFPNDPI